MELTAADGYRIGATLFEPVASNGRAVLVMAATGVPQQYYGKFSAYLAERGFTVLTFDYRGIGLSLHEPLRSVRARMRDWAQLDSACALDFLESSFSRYKLLTIGHSFGGQAFGLLPRPERIAAALTVGSQSGYWRHWPAPVGTTWMWLATHIGLPLTPRLFGYFPGSRLGLGEDLPTGVMIEWARWCRNPRYLVGDLGVEREYARFTAPIRLYAISDDRFAPERAVEELAVLYPSSKPEIRRVSPSDLNEKSIGHFGFFRERFRDSLWREARDWLEAQ
jgi:predicted alpha/beta hydrolase